MVLICKVNCDGWDLMLEWRSYGCFEWGFCVLVFVLICWFSGLVVRSF